MKTYSGILRDTLLRFDIYAVNKDADEAGKRVEDEEDEEEEEMKKEKKAKEKKTNAKNCSNNPSTRFSGSESIVCIGEEDSDHAKSEGKEEERRTVSKSERSSEEKLGEEKEARI